MSNRQIFVATLAVLAALATGYVLFMSLRVLITLLVAIIIASATRPLIGRLVKWRVPAGAAIPLIYGGIVLALVVMFIVILPPIVNQFANYLSNDGRLSSRIIIANYWLETNLSSLTGQTVNLTDPETIREATSDVLDSLRVTAPEMVNDVGEVLGDAILVIVMGLYWLISRDSAIAFLTRLVPLQHRQTTHDALLEIEESMGAYTRGLVFVALFIGIANFIILLIFQVPNAATYSFIVGVTTILPVIGGFIGGGIVTLLALLSSPVHGLIVFLTFMVVQQIEAHYLTPRVMSQSVSVDPLLVMVAVFVGFALYGATGAIISIPILSAVTVLMREFVLKPHQVKVATYSVEQGVPIFRSSDGGEVIAAPLPDAPQP
jgi:predicted PurR-regulated permease PerM